MLIQDLLLAGTPEQAALITRNATFTYAEMSEKVAAARTKLAESGVKKGDRVALVSKNSAEFVLAYLAIVSLGAVAVPVNFQLVAREIAYIIKDAGIQLVLTAQPLDQHRVRGERLRGNLEIGEADHLHAELTRQGQEIIAGNFRALEIWSAVAVIYLIITLVLSFVLRRLERRMKIL